MKTIEHRHLPVWQLTVTSFLPPEKRERAQPWVMRIPLMLILLVQMALSLRLSNSVHSDEGLYLVTGHWYRSAEPVVSRPETFFSGAPQLYPIFASYLDSVGGLWLARFFSTLCMMAATCAVYLMTRVLFAHRSGRRTGLFGALAFMLSANVLFLGHFATFDAVSFMCIAWAGALAAWSSKERRNPWWSLVIGGLAALAVLLKYSSAVDVPFVMLLTLTGMTRVRRWLPIRRGIVSGLTCLTILAGSALTWARSDLAGLVHTTLERSVPTKASAALLTENVFTWTGITLVLMILGGLYTLRRQPLVSLVLLAGLAAATTAQIHSGEATSLHKHVVLGLIFGAPLAGHLLSDLIERWRVVGLITTTAILWSALVLGLAQSATLFNAWPNTKGLAETLSYSVKAMPWIRAVGDVPEPVEYAFRDRTHHWQWTATWAGSFSYKGKHDLEAYKLALKDNYFQLAFFDTATRSANSAYCGSCTPISRDLTPQMKSFGFKQTGTVVAPDGHAWAIWQRYDGLKAPKK